MHKTKSDNPSVSGRFTGKGVFPHQMAFTLLFPLRNIFLSPRQLIKRLEIKPDSQVLEVGPGPGYFSLKVASFLTAGKLVIADIQKEMLDMAEKRLAKKGLTNVEYYLCDGYNFNIPDNSFDAIFLITVIGEVENKEQYIKEFSRLIRPGGILSISEQRGDPDKLSIAEVRNLISSSDFSFYRLYGKEGNYTINFIKT